MFPGDGIMRAAQRWLRLLSRSTFDQAAALVRSDPAYTDLSQTQYASAIDWLRSVALLLETGHGLVLAPIAEQSTVEGRGQLIFAKALEAAAPPWLTDADTLVADADELPDDAASLAAALGLNDNQALLSLRQVHGRIDLAERARVGAAGEAALVKMLERQWPGSTQHVSLNNDGLGYDIVFRHADTEQHLEVKSTTRRGRLTIHLSRHEHNVAKLDPHWQLVIVGLDATNQAAAIATAPSKALLSRSPRDLHPSARWDSVRHDLTPADLKPGLVLASKGLPPESPLCGGGSREFAWMPG